MIILTEEISDYSPADYIHERVDQYQSWYDKKAVTCKSLYMYMQGISIIAGVTVPVLINLNWPSINIFTTIISLIVIIFVSLESVFHYREQWKNYRSTEQLLGHEKIRYLTKTGPYQKLDEISAFLVFVDRVETAISTENSATLNVLTHIAESEKTKQR